MEKRYCIMCGTELPYNARFCMNCGKEVIQQQNVSETAASVSETATGVSLKEFRRNAVNVGNSFREALLAFRKSLDNAWDYNAYMGILLGVRGPKHGDLACYGYAIGQGDNGNNTKKILDAKGLMPLFEKYKKGIDENILLADVEEEIIAAVPEYRLIWEGLHRILDGQNKMPQPRPVQNKVPQPQPVQNKVPQPQPVQNKMPQPRSVQNKVPQPQPAQNKVPQPQPVQERMAEKKISSQSTGEWERQIMDTLIDKAWWTIKAKTDRNPECSETITQINERFKRLTQGMEADTLMSNLERWVSGEVGGDKAENVWHGIKAYILCVYYEHACDTFVMYAFLIFVEQLGFGKANYVLGKIDGRGLNDRIKTGEKEETFIIEVNEAKKWGAFKKAMENKYPCYDGALELGVIYMEYGRIDEAQKYLELAKQAGIKDAEIYLRYIEHSRRVKIPAVLGTRSTHNLAWKSSQSPSDYDRRTFIGNIKEYKGYIYSYSPIRNDNGLDIENYILSRVNIASGEYKALVRINRKRSDYFSGGDAGYVEHCMVDPRPHFSIYNDVIYFLDSEGISTMNLDGTNRRSLQEFASTSKVCYDMPIAFSHFMLYRRNYDICIYDYNLKSKDSVCKNDMSDIFGLSEKEINIKNKTILNLETFQKEKVENVYPLLKGKKADDIWYIDMTREIAYHIERSAQDSGNCRLIGSDKAGNIVDLWHLPYTQESVLRGGSDSVSFNECGLTIKYSKYGDIYGSTKSYLDWYSKQEENKNIFKGAVYAIDRMGNRRVLYKRNDKTSVFGDFHIQTENGIIVLEREEGNGMNYYASMIPRYPEGNRHTLFAQHS